MGVILGRPTNSVNESDMTIISVRRIKTWQRLGWECLSEISPESEGIVVGHLGLGGVARESVSASKSKMGEYANGLIAMK